MDLITIGNNGPEISSTNYWESPAAARGYCFLSINAGTFRLLIPDAMLAETKEWLSSSIVIVSRGLWPDQGNREGVEILFEGNAEFPQVLHITVEQVDRLPRPADQDRPGQPPRWRFSAWTKQGKILDLPARFRKVKKIPCLKSF